MRDFVLPADSLAGQTFEINPANPATGSVERLTFTQGTQHRLWGIHRCRDGLSHGVLMATYLLDVRW